MSKKNPQKSLIKKWPKNKTKNLKIKKIPKKILKIIKITKKSGQEKKSGQQNNQIISKKIFWSLEK